MKRYRIRFPDRTLETGNVRLELTGGNWFEDRSMDLVPWGLFMFQDSGGAVFIPAHRIHQIIASGDVKATPVDEPKSSSSVVRMELFETDAKGKPIRRVQKEERAPAIRFYNPPKRGRKNVTKDHQK